jgi:pyruvate dehydrogenase E2 component (dihydrolipoyllysine-residue acetyltransferase)
MANIIMPQFSDSMIEGTIISWLKGDGEQVRIGEELVEIETDKATMVYDSPDDGELAIVVEAGRTVPVGELIASVGAREPVTDAPNEAVGDGDKADLRTAGEHEPGEDSERLITPVARRLALVYGVDLSTVRGTGRQRRVLRRDVEAAAAIASETQLDSAIVKPPSHEKDGEQQQPNYEWDLDHRDAKESRPIRVELTRIQQVIANRMTDAKNGVPEFQVQADVEMDSALDMRRRLKEFADEDVPSINDLIIKAAALALRDWPRVNASYVDGHVELHPQINVGIAVATSEALLVPVVTDADHRSLTSIAGEARRLATRARSGEISSAEMAGGTFTISNLGMYGIRSVNPIINPPQAAILGVGAARTVLALAGDRPVERRVLTLILNCDHRIIYGADAAQFLNAVRAHLEQPLRLAF